MEAVVNTFEGSKKRRPAWHPSRTGEHQQLGNRKASGSQHRSCDRGFKVCGRTSANCCYTATPVSATRLGMQLGAEGMLGLVDGNGEGI